MSPPTIAAYDHRDFPLELLGECKGDQRVSVCIPARNEAATLAGIVASVATQLRDRVGLVDEIVVVDDGSSDDTAAVAENAGAVVFRSPGPPGKGRAMSLATACASGDILVYLDADVDNFAPHFVTGLLGPLLVDSRLVLVKGRYERPLGDAPTGGGRVTELVARPVISLLFPDIAGVEQPLAGETALRRRAADAVEFEPDYGVELGLLIDVAERFGTLAIAQVDLGVRSHRNRPLGELGSQAREVLRAALDRSGMPVSSPVAR